MKDSFQFSIFGLLLIFFWGNNSALSQNFTSSNLPIVIINTDIDPVTQQPAEIPDDPRVLATMKIIKRPDGSRNYLTDQNTAAYLNYTGRISIEVRGSTSQILPKKPYGITTLQADNTTNDNVSLLGMPKENDWILNALAFDPSLIRDYLSYHLSNQIGNYAPRTVYCEVMLNGEYRGLYLLEEKIKTDSKRVNILKIGPTENTLPELSGGYLVKADKTTGNDPVAWTMSSYAQETDFIFDTPKPSEITIPQGNYIHNQFTSLASVSHSNNENIAIGYPSLIDIPSFLDFMVINELASNVDAYQFSTYFHKDRNGKLRAGPVWDFNLSYGNDFGDPASTRSRTDVWQFSNGDNEGAKFWRDLFNNSRFKCYLSKRWNQLQQLGQPLEYNQLTFLIDNTVSLINEARVRENLKWGTIPNHPLEISNLKNFLDLRIHWINDNLGSFSACDAVVLPALVIDKINYHPGTTGAFPQSDDLEFIEITNTENTSVNLTGIYFRELGITYKFPNNATIAAGAHIYLASNLSQFQLRYGFAADGQFTRNLSNSSQKLVLADAWGNVIDQVEYFDSAPWPDADGNGSYLQLISPDLDNNVASSWKSEDEATLTATAFSLENSVTIYPNPGINEITISGLTVSDSFQLYDTLGHCLYSSREPAATAKINCSSWTKGVYLLVVKQASGWSYKKIIKQ